MLTVFASLPSINPLSVVVAGAAAVVLGFLWYGPFFGKPWMKIMGFNKEDMQKAMKNGMGKTYALMIVTVLITAYVLANAIGVLSDLLLRSELSISIMVAFWMWLGFQVPVLMDAQLWEGKTWKLFAINASYRLAGLLVMGAILALWM